MNVGLIAKWDEESFRKAQAMGLDFLEFCVNKADDADGFLAQVDELRRLSVKYNVAVGSVGRWKAETIRPDGQPDEEELRIAYGLIEAAATLGSPVYVCGCNEVGALSYYENCTAAIRQLELLLAHGRKHGVTIATFNCRKGTFIHSPSAWNIIHGHLPELAIKYDPSHSIYAGADYLLETGEWGNRFAHVHLKGSLLLNGKRVDDPPAGMDQTDWPMFLSILRARGYDGGLSIEPHSDTWKDERLDEGILYTLHYMETLMPERVCPAASVVA